MADPIRLTHEEMLERSARALGKVDAWARRGVTVVTADEIEAMACLLAALGLPGLGKDEPFDPAAFAAFPTSHFQTFSKGA
jgi:hypothetical protein